MDIMDLSPKGKKKLTRWIGQQTRKHNNICISKMIGYAPNEHKLMKMMRYIDKWHDEILMKTQVKNHLRQHLKSRLRHLHLSKECFQIK